MVVGVPLDSGARHHNLELVDCAASEVLAAD